MFYIIKHIVCQFIFSRVDNRFFEIINLIFIIETTTPFMIPEKSIVGSICRRHKGIKWYTIGFEDINFTV